MTKLHFYRYGEHPDLWETQITEFSLIKSHIGNYIGPKKGTIGDAGHPLSDRNILIEIEQSDNSDRPVGIYEYIKR